MTHVHKMPRHVLITGAGGNLGAKSVEILSRLPWCHRITALHSPRRSAPPPSGKVTSHGADLADAAGDWRRHLEGVDAVLHFAAVNPVPESDWADAMASADITFNLGLVALAAGVGRFVNCSSNHAIGGYKDPPLAATVSGGRMSEGLPPAPGTRWSNGRIDIDSTPYGASKAFAERFFVMLAAQSGGRMTTLSLRIGWALPGANDPRDISVSGSPTGQGATEAAAPDEVRALRWFRNMWISNGDFERLAVAALTADATGWPAPGLIINGVSDNAGTDWSLAAARRYLGYAPQDDIYRHLAKGPA
jgi:nucleoside-diphosphate-sugar epimerase